MIKAGGLDMPPKTDPYDMTTPSGEVPIFISMALWEAARAYGFDLRWYAVAQPIPTGD